MRAKIQSAIVIGAALWCLAIVAAPIFDVSPIYKFFSAICHQYPDRSWSIAGRALPVCIRCTSIYFGFFVGIVFSRRPDWKLLRFAVKTTVVEFIIALLVFDSVWLRSASGLLLGIRAAPFVRIGIEE